MKFFGPLFVVVISAIILSNPLQAQVAAPPFTITLEENTFTDWPGLHSFALGEWDNRWFVMTGRSGGLHGFIPPNTFPVLEANLQIHQFDPETGEYNSTNLLSLPENIRDQLHGTNAQHFQRGKYLYIVGGYGNQAATDSLVTYPSMLAVDLALLGDLMAAGASLEPAIRIVEDTLFMVSGGEIGLLDDDIYLFGGHVFGGEYSKPAGPQFYQAYTNSLKKFKITDDGTTINITDVSITTDTAVFHRRDLNFVPIMQPGEVEALVAFSGVFQYEGDFVWFSPVYVTPDGYVQDEAFYQKLNNYTCPVMGVYDSVSQNYYATLFGGIGQYYYKEEEDTIKQDLNVPFVNDISTIIKYADGTTTQYPQPIHFDGLLGTNAAFILNDAIPHYNNKIIQLHHVNGTQLAGYIYGGIDALIPNFTPSTASNRLFKVWINYEQPVSTVQLEKYDIAIYPNPANNTLNINNGLSEVITKIEIINQLGEVIATEATSIQPGYTKSVDIQNLPLGLYYIKLQAHETLLVKSWIKN